jgi:hypothetical protein
LEESVCEVGPFLVGGGDAAVEEGEERGEAGGDGEHMVEVVQLLWLKAETGGKAEHQVPDHGVWVERRAIHRVLRIGGG